MKFQPVLQLIEADSEVRRNVYLDLETTTHTTNKQEVLKSLYRLRI